VEEENPPEFGAAHETPEDQRLGDADQRTLQQITRAKQEWERTLDSVSDLIAIMDTNHRIRRVTRAMANRLGVFPKEIIGKTCYFFGMWLAISLDRRLAG